MPPDTGKKPRSIWSAIGHAIKALFEWIPEHLGDPALAAEIRGDLGLKPDAQLPEDKAAKFRQFAAGLDPDKESFAETVAEIGDVAAEIAVLQELLESDDDQAMVHLTYLLLSLAATDSVRIRVPAVYSTARALLFLAQDVESLVAIDPARLLRQLRGEDLPSGEALAQRIAFAGALVLQLLDGLIDGKDNPESADPEKPGHVDIFSGWDLAPESVTPKADLLLLRATTFDIGRVDGTGGRLFATILYVPPEHGGAGVFLSLGGALELDRVIGQTHVKFEAGVGDGFNLFIPIGDDAMDTAAQVLGDPVPFLRLTAGAGKPDEPALRIGDPDSTRLDIYETELAVEVRADDAAVRAAVRNAELVVVPGSEDGFLAAIVGDGAKVRLTLGFIADSKGFRLDGGTKLSATLPVGRSIAGLLTVHHVEIALGPSSTGGDLGLEVSGAFTATLGPFTAVVDRLGFRLDLDRREDANLGLFHVEPSFKPPSGIGLRLDAGVVKGGGYLFTDPANHEYAGALELEVFSWTVKAIGVLTHRPGGGWSLLLFVYAQFPPYPLPFGFTLNGIGGLVGVQHGVDLVAAQRRHEDQGVRRHPVPRRPGGRRATHHQPAAHAVPGHAARADDRADGRHRLRNAAIPLHPARDHRAGRQRLRFRDGRLRDRADRADRPGQGRARPDEERPGPGGGAADRRHPRLLGLGRQALRLHGPAARLAARAGRRHRWPRRVRSSTAPTRVSSSPPAGSTRASRTCRRRWVAPSTGSARASRSAAPS